MGISNPYNVGAELAVRQSVAPQSVLVANSGVAINGAAVDLQADGGIQAASFKAAVHVGGLSAGTPVVTSVVQKIQHSPDGSTNWTDFKPDGVNTAQSTVGATALSTSSNLSVNARMAQRYVRQVITPTFTGAASGIFLAGDIALGGFPSVPVTDLNA